MSKRSTEAVIKQLVDEVMKSNRLTADEDLLKKLFDIDRIEYIKQVAVHRLCHMPIPDELGLKEITEE